MGLSIQERKELIERIRQDILGLEEVVSNNNLLIYKEDVLDVLNSYDSERDPYASKINETLGILGQ